jgi:hypothetical protein
MFPFFVRTSMSEHCPWRYVAVLAALAAIGVSAQPAAPSAPFASPAAAAAAHPNSTPYRSAFEGYQPFSEQRPVPWAEANDTVRAVGGWRAYAKEASEAEEQPQPATSSPGKVPHDGHGQR